MDRRPLIRALALALPLVLAVPATAADVPAAPPRVAAVELRAPPGEDGAALAGLVALSAGEPLGARALRRTVQLLFQTGRFRNVVVRAEPAAPPPGAGGEWVRVIIEALPVRVIERVNVRADRPEVLDAAALRAEARLIPGEPFDDGELETAAARVRAAFARRGHRDARVETAARGDALVTVELAVRTGPSTRIRALRLVGRPGPAAEALAERLRTRPGAVLDLDVLDADVRALRAGLHAVGYRRARVGTPEVAADAGGAEVKVPVEAGPRLAFVFRGNSTIPAAVLASQLGFEEDQPVDAPAIGAATDRLAGFYRARGYAGVRIEAHEVPSGSELMVVLHVDEGRRFRLGAVRFDGAGARTEASLRKRLFALLEADGDEPSTKEADEARALLLSVPGVRPPPAAPAPLAASRFFDEAAWDRAAERLVDEYRADGWIEAVYLGSTLALDGRRRVADVTLRLREGSLTRVESISFEGNRVVSLPELAHEARVAPGEPLRFEQVEDTRTAILRLYAARGYAYARVEAREDLDRERHLAAVRYVVDEGPRVRIGRIVVTGNRRTRTEVVRGVLTVSEGDVYDPEAVTRSQAALLRLGVFRSVGLRLQDADLPQETKDLAVELAERPYATLSQGVGYSIANGPRVFVEYGRPNLLGRALELTARAKVNYPVQVFGYGPDLTGQKPIDRIEGRTDVGLRSARFELLPFPATVRIDAIGELLHRRAYDLGRVSGVAGVDVGLTSRIGFSGQYELEVDNIRRSEEAGRLTQADVERLRFDEGVTTLNALRGSASLDFRDNSAHPHRGWFAAGSVEYARSLGAAVPGSADRRPLLGLLPASEVRTNMMKVSGTLSGYLPIGRASVVALSLRAGRVFPLDRDSRTIIPRRFFLGGASSMRGYGEEAMIQQDVRAVLAAEARQCATSLTAVGCTESGRRIARGERPVSEGGEAFLLAKAELRLALTSSLETGFFVDLGNVWLDPRQYRLLDLRANVGFGVRFVTPIGPAALDLGFNVQPDQRINEAQFAPHFTIGLF